MNQQQSSGRSESLSSSSRIFPAPIPVQPVIVPQDQPKFLSPKGHWTLRLTLVNGVPYPLIHVVREDDKMIAGWNRILRREEWPMFADLRSQKNELAVKRSTSYLRKLEVAATSMSVAIEDVFSIGRSHGLSDVNRRLVASNQVGSDTAANAVGSTNKTITTEVLDSHDNPDDMWSLVRQEEALIQATESQLKEAEHELLFGDPSTPITFFGDPESEDSDTPSCARALARELRKKYDEVELIISNNSAERSCENSANLMRLDGSISVDESRRIHNISPVSPSGSGESNRDFGRSPNSDTDSSDAEHENQYNHALKNDSNTARGSKDPPPVPKKK